jgi:hypothetical protein
MLIHVDWVVLSRFKFIISQNLPQYISISSNPHGMKITEPGLNAKISTNIVLSITYLHLYNISCITFIDNDH